MKYEIFSNGARVQNCLWEILMIFCSLQDIIIVDQYHFIGIPSLCCSCYLCTCNIMTESMKRYIYKGTLNTELLSCLYVNDSHKERPNHRGSKHINLWAVSFVNHNSRSNNILVKLPKLLFRHIFARSNHTSRSYLLQLLIHIYRLQSRTFL